MSIDQKQLSKLVYFMATFDGGVYPVGKNASFIMNMRTENLDYLLWVKSTLENITSVSLVDRKDYNTDGYNRKPQKRLYSSVHPYFNKVRDRLYIDNKKVLDPHMLSMLDAEALAIIFMADGSTALDKRWTNPHGKIDLCTKGFSYFDNLALSKAIYDKCGICTTVRRHNNYWYLGIKTAHIISFIDMIHEYVLPSFYYKLERIAPAIKRMRGGDIV